MYAPPVPTEPEEAYSVGVAYVFAIFLGFVSAHNWYIGRYGNAGGQLGLVALGVLCMVIGSMVSALNFLIWIGLVLLITFFIWWLTDLVEIPRRVRNANASARAGKLAVPRS
ncbi:hypothetical protein ASF30_12175 [Leifsonia sp. Leaf264]|nr:hypothetical protein ASF30_12175 [Leifsonia sp. Leaf264]